MLWNFLIPSGKAIRADKENKAEFEKKKESLWQQRKKENQLLLRLQRV